MHMEKNCHSVLWNSYKYRNSFRIVVVSKYFTVHCGLITSTNALNMINKIMKLFPGVYWKVSHLGSLAVTFFTSLANWEILYPWISVRRCREIKTYLRYLLYCYCLINWCTLGEYSPLLDQLKTASQWKDRIPQNWLTIDYAKCLFNVLFKSYFNEHHKNTHP